LQSLPIYLYRSLLIRKLEKKLFYVHVAGICRNPAFPEMPGVSANACDIDIYH